MDRSHWYSGGWQAGTEQVWVWDGDSWVSAVNVWVWDGDSWVKLFASDAQYTAAEALQVLDLANVVTIDRFQQYTAVEALQVLDRGGVVITNRSVNKSGRELLALSEAAVLARNFLVAEALQVLDRGGVITINRNVDKPSRELLALSEASTLSRRYTLAEALQVLDRGGVVTTSRNVDKTGRELVALSEDAAVEKRVELSESLRVLDRAAVTTVSRNIIHTARELMRVAEDASVDITAIVPVASNAIANWGSCSGNASVECSTGDNCESIKIRYRINSGGGWGSWNTMGTYNTTPNSSFGPETLSPTPSGGSGREIEFEIEPWSGNGATGAAGTKIYSNQQECGGPE